LREALERRAPIAILAVRTLGGLTALTHQPRDTPQFYLTAPSVCPYLPGRMERKVFTHIVGERAANLNDILTQGGFRRSQTIAYRPACESCQACISVRVLASEFTPSRGYRRIAAHNSDIIGATMPATPSSEQYALFRSYIDARHGEGGMADMSAFDYATMVRESHVQTRIVEYREQGSDARLTGRGQPLLAVALTDILADGLSMVYSFFDPQSDRRSLGTFLILDHIDKARALGLPYVYLGYWVSGSRKMDYKCRFRPQERLTPEGWARAP
jgi:arginyl-tRNA--protein-N-Asp/Glu arginylyltransferase